MKKTAMLMIVFALLAAISACATQSAEPQSLAQMLEAKQYVFGEPVDRIRNHRINGWNYLDERHVIISAGVSDRYLLVLRSPCRNLKTAVQLAFTSTAGSLTGFDKLVVSGPGSFIDHCYIGDIYRVKKIESTETTG